MRLWETTLLVLGVTSPSQARFRAHLSMHQYCKVVTAVIRAAQGRFFNHPRTCEKQINSHTAFGDTRSLCVLLVHQRHLLDVLSLHASDKLGLQHRNVRRCADSDSDMRGGTPTQRSLNGLRTDASAPIPLRKLLYCSG